MSRCRLTLVVAVPPPTGLTIFTSTGPQLCVSVSCVCCQRCTQILIRAASSVHTHTRMKRAVKCKRWCSRTSSREKLFLVQLLSLSSPMEEKMALKFRIWRSRPHLHTAHTDQWEASQHKNWITFYSVTNTVSHCPTQSRWCISPPCFWISCHNSLVNWTFPSYNT